VPASADTLNRAKGGFGYPVPGNIKKFIYLMGLIQLVLQRRRQVIDIGETTVMDATHRV
jgi:hypothetical protein